MGKGFQDTFAEMMKDPEFKAEWDALEPEFRLMQAIIEVRKKADIAQKQFSYKRLKQLLLAWNPDFTKLLPLRGRCITRSRSGDHTRRDCF